ncbi:MAG: hypothetical protein JNM28_02520 [Armatimonadetes bacterium]|nr:hypothetical protein [Armatimonadota bacterium]
MALALGSFGLLAGCDPGTPKSDTGKAAAGDQSGTSAEASTAAQPNRGAAARPDKSEGK